MTKLPEFYEKQVAVAESAIVRNRATIAGRRSFACRCAATEGGHRHRQGGDIRPGGGVGCRAGSIERSNSHFDQSVRWGEVKMRIAGANVTVFDMWSVFGGHA